MKPWSSGPLQVGHDLSAFRSGNDALDRWLRDGAHRAHAAGTAHTTVWTPPSADGVVAFHAIAPTQFTRAELPSRSLSAGYSQIPGYLIARLALDHTLHGQGLGSQLLLDALERIVVAAGEAGGRLIAVDAIDDAAHRFYRHHDFLPIHDSSRLVMKVSTARQALGL
ncbi:acetyltransferase [Paraconexibacter sp. AEG42_29]|uniref:Acetyltransferase n=1 Tax=Paraconexibacter sp. AEG42_29 TaxID=2997339 RepID=A0AAU7APE7_9ACTN